MAQTYVYAIGKLPLTQNIIRPTRVYKSLGSYYTNELLN